MIKPWHAVLAIILSSFVLAIIELPTDTWLTPAALSLACGVAALAMMGAVAILASRWTWIEDIFGGLDRVYAVHKWLAVYALALASMHLLFKAGDETWMVGAIIELPRDWTRLVRQASFIALMVIVVLALNRNIPYSQWRWWHRLSGPLFLIVIAHWLSIRSPVEITSPAGLWLAGFAFLGVVSAAYKLLLYPFLARHADYRVMSVSRGPSAAEIEFEPTKRGVDFRAGHFGFLRMKVDGLREPHPFTIASAPTPGGRITFVIRALGDYTNKLIANVSPGMHADVYAPYGRFERRPEYAREIWIGGGVGISPFIAWMRDQHPQGFKGVVLFYFFSPGRAFPETDALQAMAEERGIEFVPVSTGPATPSFVERFGEALQATDPSSVDIAVCGPQGLLEAVRKLASANNYSPDSIRHEFFAFR